MKQTFAAKTFAAKTFASGTWTGVGVPPVAPAFVAGNILVFKAEDPGRVFRAIDPGRVFKGRS